MHALSARPLKVHGGRGSDTYADETIKINPISLCSHTDAHPNLNREVRHSLTWHSSESESALERFEPVAAAMLWSDGQGTLFARVAARRRKVFKRGIDTYAEHVCRRRRDGSQFFPLFVLFVLFGQAKRTLKEKLLYVSIRRKQAVPCLGDAVQRWLRHPEPSSSSLKSTIKKRNFQHFLCRKTHQTKKRMANHPFSFKNSIIQ